MLFDALVRENAWREAEALAVQDGPVAARLGQVAAAAGRAGETREAMRIWARRTNLDRLSPDGVEEMIAAVGRDAVAAHDEEIGSRDRSFRVPARLLK
jgi:hypothetical protein